MLLSIAFAAFVFQASAEDDWKTARFGTFGPVVSYPSILRPDPINENDEFLHTMAFHSPDGAFAVTFQNYIWVPSADFKGDTLSALMRADRADYRGSITFQRRHGRGYTIVARRGDTKVFIQKFGHRPYANGVALRALTIEFPHARRAEFDPWLERIAASYQPYIKP